MPRVLLWQVTGMTCTSCEKLIGNVLRDAPGVIDVEVSLKQSKAAVRLRDDAKDPDLQLLNKQLSAHGYTLYPQGCPVPASALPFRARLVRALSAIFGVGIVLYLLGPFRALVPSVSAGASVGALFFLGVVASVSSCLATTGGFLLAYSAEASSRRKTVLMHLGRLTAFVVGGAVLGAIGGALPAGSAIWYGVLGLILGVGFLGVALNLLELSPSLAKMGIALPASFQGFADRIRKRPGNVTPFLVGAVTFILPCGFTQTAQALALASGSAGSGLLLLAAFALGTLPVLLGVTGFATSATLKHQSLRLIMGAVLFFFAMGQLQSGLTVLGVPLSLGSIAGIEKVEAVDAVPSDGVQVIRMEVNSYGYAPRSFTIKKGVPVRWEINGKDVSGCTNSIVSRDLGISQPLNEGLNVINFTPTRTGTVAFSCAMGMVRGSFTVI